MENEVILGIILAALSGLYFALYKQHGCLRKIESKVNTVAEITYIREELTNLEKRVSEYHG